MRTSALLAATLATFGFAQLAGAAADTDDLLVSADVVNSCTIASATTLAFGTYDTVSRAAVPGSTTIAVACTRGTTNTITLGQGAQPAGGSSTSVPLRQMTDGGANRLAYKLFSDEAHLNVWGDTALTGLDYFAVDSLPSAQTVFGEITSGQDVPVGSYADTVVATITF